MATHQEAGTVTITAGKQIGYAQESHNGQYDY
jgi:hypothetical protein